MAPRARRSSLRSPRRSDSPPDGSIDELVYTSLADFPVGEAAEVRRVDTSQPDRLRYLEHSGLTPGTRLTVLQRQPFSGPISIRIAPKSRIIGHELAQQVLLVRPEAR
jgi:DtxR family Mn-dependent transcriptional regulator